MKKILFVSLAIILTITSCKKDGLTKESHKGANTLSCKIDGVIFKPYDARELDFFVDHYPVLSVSNCRSSNRFGISADNQKTGQSISIEYTYVTQAGAYKLKQYPFRGIYEGGYAGWGWFTTDSIYTGQLNFTRCDTINKIYSGTFYFTAKERDGRIVKITEGRFDLKE